jgi:DNA-binding LytR/AlgR family response regulator
MNINCIVIDDEPLALDLIASHIQKVSYLQLKGLFHRAIDAMKVLHEEKIDLIFLDINMPDISGIEFLKGLQNPPKVIFITAYDQFAVQGFEVNAVDYLLKPVSFNRFLLASNRALALMDKRSSASGEYIFVRSEHNNIRVALDSIHYIEGYRDYLKIHTADKLPILTITTFKAIEALLPDTFLRIHRSYIISVDKIVLFRNSNVLVKDKYIPIGESYRELFHNAVVAGKISV